MGLPLSRQTAIPNPDYKYVFAPITFEYVVNSADQGDFYEGMLPDVLATDDITHDCGDPQEASLTAAIATARGYQGNNQVYSTGGSGYLQ
ncbi:MAG: hypothetical protein MZV63_24795 [Marinilabiliales bacterium]|nr:hypothetical protein [Marinilabiliales bacterium]